MTYWTVPRLWPGETVAILASGPSMSQDVADSVRGMPTIAVSDAYRLAPWADMLYSADARWWLVHEPVFAGLKVCAQTNCKIEGVNLIRTSGVEGFDPDPSRVRTGGNSGYQAIHVAIHAGASKILLFGFDMRGTHFFGRHPAPLRNTPQESFAKWVGKFSALNGRGAEIVNCTPGSALTCFGRLVA